MQHPGYLEFDKQTITLTLNSDRMDVFLKQKETGAPKGKPQKHRGNMSPQKEPRRKSALRLAAIQIIRIIAQIMMGQSSPGQDFQGRAALTGEAAYRHRPVDCA